MRAYHACPCACLSYHAQYWLQYICARRYAYSISLTNTHTHWYTYTHIHTYTYTQRVCIHTTRMSMRGLSCIHHLTRLPISPKASRFYEGQTANLTAVWRVKGHIGWKFFYETIFGWQNPGPMCVPEFGNVHFILRFYGDSSTGRGSTKTREKLAKMLSSKVWSRWKVGRFYLLNQTERWISQPFFARPQSPLDDFRTTFWEREREKEIMLFIGKPIGRSIMISFEIFIKLLMFDSSRATCVLLRGQNQILVPSGWGKARKNLKIFVEILSAVASNRSRAQAKDLRKLH